MVISMCGSDGTGGPACRTSTPAVNRGAASSSPETSCDDPEASSVTGAARTEPEPWMVNGSAPRPPSSIDTPSVAQRGEQRADRPFAGPRVAVERDVGRGERRHRGQEPHDRAGVADVDADRGARGRRAGSDARAPCPC